MRKLIKKAILCFCGVMAFCNLALAETKKDDKVNVPSEPKGYVGIRAYGGYSSIISGEAGDRANAPNYSDAFDNSFGIGLEGAFKPQGGWFSFHIGAFWVSYDGESYKGVRFSDLDVTDVYAGLKFHFIKSPKDWDPYLRADIGMSHIDDVKIRYKGMGVNYWDDSTVLNFGLGVGTNVMFSKNFGGFMEAKFVYRGAPDEKFGAAKADGSWSIPILLGLEYRF